MGNRDIFSLLEEWSAAADRFLKTKEGLDLLKDLQPWEQEIITILVRSLMPLPEDAQPLLAFEADGFKEGVVKIALEKLGFQYRDSMTAEEDVKSDFFFLRNMADNIARAISRYRHVTTAQGRSARPEAKPVSDRPTRRVDSPDPLLAIDEPWQDMPEGPSGHATVPAPPGYEKLSQRSGMSQSGLYGLAVDVERIPVNPAPQIVDLPSVCPAIPPPPWFPASRLHSRCPLSRLSRMRLTKGRAGTGQRRSWATLCRSWLKSRLIQNLPGQVRIRLSLKPKSRLRRSMWIRRTSKLGRTRKSNRPWTVSKSTPALLPPKTANPRPLFFISS